jgi:hypothetical protein
MQIPPTAPTSTLALGVRPREKVDRGLMSRTAQRAALPTYPGARYVFRFFPLLRALLRCFFPGGPSGLPAGVLLSPFFFSLAMSDPTPRATTQYEARGDGFSVEVLSPRRRRRSVRAWSLVERAEGAAMDLFAADEQGPGVLQARVPDDHWSGRRALRDFKFHAAHRAPPLAVDAFHLGPPHAWTTHLPSARGLLARKTSAQATGVTVPSAPQEGAVGTKLTRPGVRSALGPLGAAH